MKDSSNQYALAALRERRAEIAGEITELESRLRHLRESLTCLDGTLALFQPGDDPKAVKPIRPYHRVKLFGAGKLNRMVLDALRRGGRPMTTAEVVSSICEALGYGEDATKGMKNRVRSNLAYLARVGGSVVKEGEREGARWGLRS